MRIFIFHKPAFSRVPRPNHKNRFLLFQRIVYFFFQVHGFILAFLKLKKQAPRGRPEKIKKQQKPSAALAP